jgi:hypothetical protein
VAAALEGRSDGEASLDTAVLGELFGSPSDAAVLPGIYRPDRSAGKMVLKR